MKRMLLLVALLTLTATSALAQGTSYLGMFADQTPETPCNAPTALYTTTSVYFYAVLDATAVPSINACQFKVENLPAAAGQGLVTVAWNTTLVIGEPATDVALAFNPVLTAPYAYLGRIDFFPLAAGWIGSDYLMQIVPANGQASIWIVPETVEVAVPGGPFYFNYTGGDDGCGGPAVEESSWGSIKSLY